MENGRLIFRSVAFVLAVYFFITNIILGFYILRAGSWGGGLKFLTNWNLLLNFIIACCALINERDRKFVSYYFVLPASMVLNVLVFILYWLIKLLGGFGAGESGWSIFDVLKDYYMHLELRCFCSWRFYFIRKLSKTLEENSLFLV